MRLKNLLNTLCFLQPMDPPEIVADLQQEQEEGLFRNITGVFARNAIGYYTQQAADRFEHINPALSAPPGASFTVVCNTTKGDSTTLASGYVRIVTCTHGLYVQMRPAQMVAALKRVRDTKIAATFGWSTFWPADCAFEVYYADPDPAPVVPPTPAHAPAAAATTGSDFFAPRRRRRQERLAQSAPYGATARKAAKPTHKATPDFPRRHYYTSVMNVRIHMQGEKNHAHDTNNTEDVFC